MKIEEIITITACIDAAVDILGDDSDYKEKLSLAKKSFLKETTERYSLCLSYEDWLAEESLCESEEARREYMAYLNRNAVKNVHNAAVKSFKALIERGCEE